MGSADTLEIKATLIGPPRLLLYSHRQRAELVRPVDQACFDCLSPILAETEASFWLRSVSRQLMPFFGLWTRRGNYGLVVRVKHGASRRDLTVPCSRYTGESLLIIARKEWSDAV